MTKPRFTADPPLYLDGLSEDEKLRRVVEYKQRQFQRIDDLWPEDFQARIELLESLFPGIPGTWPIVDYSSILFSPQAAVPTVLKGFVYEGGQLWYLKSDYTGFEWGTPVTTVDLSQVRGWVTDGNGNIMAGGPGTEIIYSTDDGATMNHVAMPDSDSGSFASVAYTNGNWYAIGKGTVGEGYPFKCWRSSNMVDWTEIYEETDSAKLAWVPVSAQSLCLDNSGNLCAITEKAGDKDHHFRKSVDGGSTWSFADINDLSGWNVGDIKNVNGNLVVTGNKMTIMFSDDDGATWSTPVNLRANQFEFAGGLEYGDGRYIYQMNSGSPPRVTFYSTNLVDWNSYNGFNSIYQSLHYNETMGFIFTFGNSVQQSDTGLNGSWTDWSGVSNPVNSIGLYIYDAPLTL